MSLLPPGRQLERRPSGQALGDLGPHAASSLLAPIAAFAVLSVGCAFAPPAKYVADRPAANLAPSDQRAMEPSPSPPVRYAINKDSIVRLVVGGANCSGSLIGEDLVLTAHHCVSARDSRGHVLSEDVAPEDVTVELGSSHLPWGEVGVRAILSPDCGYERGEGDIAILVLSRKLVGMPTLAPRTDAAPQAKEHMLPWGYGRCALSHSPIELSGRIGGEIDSVYRGEFLGQASICPGDSGGPALNANDEIIGVISTSAMDGDENTTGITHYARIDRWKELFAAAREVSNGASTVELPPYRMCTF